MILTPLRAPNANAERVIATVRAECLDWTLILGRRHLDRTLATYTTPWGTKTRSCGPHVLVDEPPEEI